MTTMIACLIAALSTTGCITLWFWIAQRELRARQDTVVSAQGQLVACRKGRSQARKDARDAEAVFARSRDIYAQAVALYNESLQKPQNRIPGFFLGFRRIEGI